MYIGYGYVYSSFGYVYSSGVVYVMLCIQMCYVCYVFVMYTEVDSSGDVARVVAMYVNMCYVNMLNKEQK